MAKETYHFDSLALQRAFKVWKKERRRGRQKEGKGEREKEREREREREKERERVCVTLWSAKESK